MKIVAFAAPKLTDRILIFAQTHINLGELMCLFAISGPPVRMENAMICIYIHIIDFLRFRENGKRALA